MLRLYGYADRTVTWHADRVTSHAVRSAEHADGSRARVKQVELRRRTARLYRTLVLLEHGRGKGGKGGYVSGNGKGDGRGYGSSHRDFDRDFSRL